MEMGQSVKKIHFLQQLHLNINTNQMEISPIQLEQQWSTIKLPKCKKNLTKTVEKISNRAKNSSRGLIFLLCFNRSKKIPNALLIA